MPQVSSPDFRAFLQDELVRRCKANPKYSLRAFARALQVEPSFLSKLLSRKRAVTPATVQRLSKRLGLGPEQLAAFAAAPIAGAGAVSDARYRQLTLDQFQVIAEWYHYAILELVDVKGFRANPRWIARTLGITLAEANAAVERLVRLEYLEIGDDGRWENVSGSHTTVGNDFTTVAFRKLQNQILLQAIAALEEIPMEQRDQSSMTFALDSALLAEAKLRIREFRRALVQDLQKRGKARDAVYQLSVSMFPVTRISQEKSK